MTTVGNIDYKKIENRQFVTVDTDRSEEHTSEPSHEWISRMPSSA